MTPKKQSGPKRPPVILAFGEDLHDSDSIKWLVGFFRSDLPRVLSRPKPVSLSGNPGKPALDKWIGAVANAVAATEAAGQPVRAVLVHVDSDEPDPGGKRHQSLTVALSSLKVAHPVVPVQCTEAWWFLFPAQVEAVRPKVWRATMPRKARDVETINSPKTELKRLTRRSGHEYAESDSPRIAERIAVDKPSPTGTSKSFERFRSTVAAL